MAPLLRLIRRGRTPETKQAPGGLWTPARLSGSARSRMSTGGIGLGGRSSAASSAATPGRTVSSSTSAAGPAAPHTRSATSAGCSGRTSPARRPCSRARAAWRRCRWTRRASRHNRDRFDVVTALDMLEHLDDDARAVREIARVLKPGGYLVAWVPAYEFLWSEHDDAVGHRRRYVREGLERVLKGAGFHVERCAYTMTAVLPAAVGMRLAQATAPAAPHAAPKRPRQRSQTRELPAGARRWTRGRAVRPGASPLWAEHPCRGSPPAGPTGTRGG